MKYVNLQSLEGTEVLGRVFDTPAVQRVAAGTLRVDDLLGMEEQAVDAAYRLVRFYDTGGAPKCPKCQSTNNYELAKQRVWRCAQCGHDYTATSRTVFASAKMPLRNYLFGLSLVLEPSQFKSIRSFAQELNLGQKSISILLQKLCHAKAEGKDGCTSPYAILQRLTWQQLRRLSKPDRLMHGRSANLRYPYLKTESSAPGADLVLFVNSVVPRWPDAELRADMCQDLLLAILDGQASRETIKADAKKAVTKIMQQHPWKYKWISFDAPIGEDGESTLHDIISSDQAKDRYIYVNHK